MPAETQTRVEPQSEADAKMVDLPSEGAHIDVELPKQTEKRVNPDSEVEVVETEVVTDTQTASTEEMDDYGKKVQSRIDKLTKKLRESDLVLLKNLMMLGFVPVSTYKRVLGEQQNNQR